VRGLPTFTVGWIFFDLLRPVNLSAAIGFLASISLAVITSFCLKFIANLFGFWVLDYRGIATVFMAVMNLFSGMLTPLAFLPGPVRDAANVMPFRAVLMIPNEVYLGQIAIWQGLAFQLAWIAVLIVAAQWLMRVGERKLVVQGG